MAHPFERLSPDRILDAVESAGFAPDGRLLALNSYENRVYQVGIHDAEPIVAKFYRPGRWSREAIVEEHELVGEFAAAELPVVAPLTVASGTTLAEYDGFYIALYPRRGGHAPDLEQRDNLVTMGRVLARMHVIGGARPFAHRERLDPENLGHASVRFVQSECVPDDLHDAYATLANDLLHLIDKRWRAAEALRFLRVHGDCHAGNVLWRDGVPNFVDFDDARTAPAVQDLWMLLSGSPDEQRAQFEIVLEGYHEFTDFDYRELALIEVLRTLRMLHYAAWLGRRLDDPAFPRAFPWFNTQAYWEGHILELREQFAALQESFEIAGW